MTVTIHDSPNTLECLQSTHASEMEITKLGNTGGFPQLKTAPYFSTGIQFHTCLDKPHGTPTVVFEYTNA